MTAHATAHTVPSLGYIVWERRKKLKAEYRELRGEQIRDIRLSGVEVSEESRLPRLAYLGDSRPEGLDNNPDMYRAEILIAEMTFVAPSHRKDKIHKHGHMHLDDIVQRRDRFKNEQIIFAHFSTRYHARQIRDFVDKAHARHAGWSGSSVAVTARTRCGGRRTCRPLHVPFTLTFRSAVIAAATATSPWWPAGPICRLPTCTQWPRKSSH